MPSRPALLTIAVSVVLISTVAISWMSAGQGHTFTSHLWSSVKGVPTSMSAAGAGDAKKAGLSGAVVPNTSRDLQLASSQPGKQVQGAGAASTGSPGAKGGASASSPKGIEVLLSLVTDCTRDLTAEIKTNKAGTKPDSQESNGGSSGKDSGSAADDKLSYLKRFEPKADNNYMWPKRTEMIAEIIDDDSTVLDIGSGMGLLRKLLKTGCTYLAAGGWLGLDGGTVAIMVVVEHEHTVCAGLQWLVGSHKADTKLGVTVLYWIG